MDDIDRAAEREAQAREDALKEVRSKVAVGDWDVLSAKWCEGAYCGERIPDARRQAIVGVKLCVDCQAREERGPRNGR